MNKWVCFQYFPIFNKGIIDTVKNKKSTKRKNDFLGGGPHHAARGILVPRPGVEPVPPPLGAQSLNHQTTREVPQNDIFKIFNFTSNPKIKITISPSKFYSLKYYIGISMVTQTLWDLTGMSF